MRRPFSFGTQAGKEFNTEFSEEEHRGRIEYYKNFGTQAEACATRKNRTRLVGVRSPDGVLDRKF